MRLLVDENMPTLAVRRLRERGHDVLSVDEEFPGARDPEILAIANSEDRTLLTLDRDFGELVFHRRLSPRSGILLLRLRGLSAQQLADKVVQIVESKPSWSGLFASADHTTVRIVEPP